MLSKLTTFIGNIFTADTGVSFGRFSAFILMIACIVWDSAYLTFSIIHWKALFPLGMKMGDILPPVATLVGQGAFFSVPYSITKFGPQGGPASPENGQK